MELIKVGEKTYYIKNATNIGIYKIDESNVYLIDTGNDKDAGKKILKILEAQGWNVKGIISDAPSVSIREFFENVSKEVLKKGDEKVAEHAIARFKKEFGADVKDFECVDIVKNSKYPILLSAGSMEKMEEVLDELKKANPKTTDVIILPGCNHGNGMYKQTKMYQEAIKDFIQKAILLG